MDKCSCTKRKATQGSSRIPKSPDYCKKESWLVSRAMPAVLW